MQNKFRYNEWMAGWHGILSRHVSTVLLSSAGWLQNGCQSEKRTSGDCSSKMLSILKIEMIDKSDGVKFIFSSFLLSSTDSNPFESTTFNTVWSPQLRCLSPALRVRHHTMQWLQQGLQRQSGDGLRTVHTRCRIDARVPLTFCFFFGGVFGKSKWPGLPISFTKIGSVSFFCRRVAGWILFDPWFNLRHVLHARCQIGKLGSEQSSFSHDGCFSATCLKTKRFPC